LFCFLLLGTFFTRSARLNFPSGKNNIYVGLPGLGGSLLEPSSEGHFSKYFSQLSENRQQSKYGTRSWKK